MTEEFVNLGATQLSASMSPSDLTFSVVDGSRLPSSGRFRVRIDGELILCASRSSNVVTIDASGRGIEQATGGGTAASHASGAAVLQIMSYNGLETFLAERNIPVFNPKRYGAAGDNVTDDSAAFQNMLNALPTAGAVVFVPTGNYRIYTPLVYNNGGGGIRMMGPGRPYNSVQTLSPGDQVVGAKLIGMTSGMTILKFPAVIGGGGISKHAPPVVEHIGFEDGLAAWAQYKLASASWASTGGGTITFTTTVPHPFHVGDVIYLDKASKPNPGSDWDHIYTVATVPNTTTLTCLRSDNPGPWTTGGNLELEDTTAKCTMTGLWIAGQTRWHVEQCVFTRFNQGLFIDASAGDCSWGQSVDNDFEFCNKGFYGSGAVALGIEVKGGNAQVGTNQIAYAIQDSAGPRVGGMKIDVGLGQSGTGSVGIDLNHCTKFMVVGAMWEADIDHDAPNPAYVMKIHTAGQSWGDVHGIQVQGSGLIDYVNAVGIGIFGSSATNAAHAINVVGGTFQAIDTVVYADQFCRNVNIIGGTVLTAHYGIVIEAGAYMFNAIGFQHSNQQLTHPYTHITDPGGAIVNRIGCHDHADDTFDGIRSTSALGTKHYGGATPTGGKSGDIAVGNGQIWFNDAGTWRSLTGGTATFESIVAQLLAEITTASNGDTVALSYTVPANSMSAGTTYRIQAWGKSTSQATVDSGGIGIKQKFGPTESSLMSVTPTVSKTGFGWYYECLITCRSLAGSTGTFIASERFIVDQAAAASKANVTQTGTFTFSVANNQTLELDLNVVDTTKEVMSAEQVIFELVKP